MHQSNREAFALFQKIWLALQMTAMFQKFKAKTTFSTMKICSSQPLKKNLHQDQVKNSYLTNLLALFLKSYIVSNRFMSESNSSKETQNIDA